MIFLTALLSGEKKKSHLCCQKLKNLDWQQDLHVREIQNSVVFTDFSHFHPMISSVYNTFSSSPQCSISLHQFFSLYLSRKSNWYLDPILSKVKEPEGGNIFNILSSRFRLITHTPPFTKRFISEESAYTWHFCRLRSESHLPILH